MSDEPTAPGTEEIKPNRIIGWLVVGLPFGLVFMGALSFVFYFQKRNAAREAQPSRYSSMMRKDLNLEEYRRYIQVLSRDIGPRTLEKPGNVEATQSFIESTLGFDNMGYDVARREIGKNVAFEAELRGVQSPRKLVLVCARYDGNTAEPVAALFSLAHDLTGTRQADSVRFFAFDGSASAAAAMYRQWNEKEEFSSIVTLFLVGPATHSASLGGLLVPLTAPSADDPAALETLRQDKALIEQYANAPASQ